ncbi:MAG: beta-ketoacyl-ACP synthase II [Armatimonadetes bacterium]|nr:beta-ketoacyl-ACP synthase II [Armatimonadota bacterium]
MKISSLIEIRRLAPLLNVWEEVQKACRGITGGGSQILPIDWEAREVREPLSEELCPLLAGSDEWKSESQTFHLRHCLAVMRRAASESKFGVGLTFQCYCGLAHLVFPLWEEGTIVGAVISNAVQIRPTSYKEICGLARRAGVASAPLLDSMTPLRDADEEELVDQSRRVIEKVFALEAALPGTRLYESSGLALQTPQEPSPPRGRASATTVQIPLTAEAAGQTIDAPTPSVFRDGNSRPAEPLERGARPGKRRVVVTGLGVLSPVGIGKGEFLEALRSGRNGVGPITLFDPETMNSKIGGEVRDFRPEDYLDPKTIKRTGRSTQFAVAASQQAIQDSGLHCENEDLNRIGVIIGSAAGGLEYGQDQVMRYMEGGGKAVSPFLSIIIFAGACSSEISMELKAKGPSITVSTGCAASNDAFGYALHLIRDDKADVILAGGTEAPIFPVIHGSFCALRALSTRNGDPQHASRPFDRERDGFVIAEGSAIVVLEELERARARKARIYGEILGYAATGDAFHMTRPSPDGADATRAVQLAIQDSGLGLEEIQYVSAHGSSTPLNDRTETAAIKAVFGRKAYNIPVSSTKSMMGHSIGASGAFDLVAILLGMHSQFLPPTINLVVPDPDCDLDYVANRSREQRYEIALSNTFGFGGKNACIVVSKW